MASRFESGKSTYQYDVESNAITLRRVDGVMDSVERQGEELLELNRTIESLTHKLEKAEARIDMIAVYNGKVNMQLSNIQRISNHILLSPVMRFINFFTGWYTVINGTMLAYNTSPQSLDKRIARWFRIKFSKDND